MMTNTRGEKHLGGKERELLIQFKQSYPEFTGNLRADFVLTPPELAGSFEADLYKKSWNAVTSPRIDVITNTPDKEVMLIEIRPEADWTAISAIIAYRELFKMIYNYPGKIFTGILCESMSDTNEMICSRFGIKIFKVKSEADKNQLLIDYSKQPE